MCLSTWIAAPAVAQATITISDAQVTEGDGPSMLTVDGTAQAPSDYTAARGTLTVPGDLFGTSQTQTITITIAGDTTFEDRETFAVALSGTEIVKGTGIGTIFDNDPLAPPAPGRTTGPLPDQQLISRATNGDQPNAAVTEPTISGDSRIARYVAYASTATNIAPGAGGHRNIFLVTRGGSPGTLGTPWECGSTQLASPGRGAQRPTATPARRPSAAGRGATRRRSQGAWRSCQVLRISSRVMATPGPTHSRASSPPAS